MSLNPISQVIRTLREQRKASQGEVAEYADVTQPTVSSWENDHTRPSPKQEAAIYKGLGYSDEEVLAMFFAKLEKKSDSLEVRKARARKDDRDLDMLGEKLLESDLDDELKNHLQSLINGARLDLNGIQQSILNLETLFTLLQKHK